MNRNSLLACVYCALLTLLAFQGVSGALLSLNYIPVMENLKALKSIQLIGLTVKYGWFFQTLHKQAVHLIFVLSILVLLIQFNKKEVHFPTLIKWWSSVFTVMFIFFAIYSGNILVGDGYASQSFQIGGTIMKEIPLIGSLFHFLLFTPNQQELQTYSLVRMYVSHILFIPFLLGIVIFLQKPSNVCEYLKPKEILITILSVILLQIAVAFVLPVNPKVAPYSPDWFFLPIHYLQYEVPSIIVGLCIGLLLFSILMFPLIYRKRKERL
jgi:quinol-cytochrome oxidoreductase complex cytochrome b subunit